MATTKRSFGARFRGTFVTGLFILLPLFVSYVLLKFVFDLLSGVGAPLVMAGVKIFEALGGEDITSAPWFRWVVPAVNLFLSVVIVLFLGFFGKNVFGRRALAAVENFIARLPFVKSVYGATKKLVETFQKPEGGGFKKAVLIEYPRSGLWSMGLVAADRPDSASLVEGERLLAVFIPTTPNPTSGFILLVPKKDAVEIDLSVEEAFMFIVSGGIAGRDFRRAPRLPPSPKSEQNDAPPAPPVSRS